jgi:autotransporter-associated beta strand protein
MFRSPISSRIKGLAALAAGLIFASGGLAQFTGPNFTWVSSTSGVWSNGANWNPVGPPPSNGGPVASGGTVLGFNSGTYTASNDIASMAVIGMYFNNNNAGGITLADGGGGAINLATQGFANNGQFAVMYQNGSGPVNITAPLVNNGPATVASSQDAYVFGNGAGSLTFGNVSGANGFYFVGQNSAGSTFFLNDGTNSFASGGGLTGGVQIASPFTTVQTTATSGTPFGLSGIQAFSGTFAVTPSGSGQDVALGLAGGATSTGKIINFSASGNLLLDKGTQNSLTFNVRAITFGESSNSEAVMGVIPGGGSANFGVANGSGLPVTEALVAFGAPTLVGGMIAPNQIIQTSKTDAHADFMTYGAAGTVTNSYSKFTGYTNYTGGTFGAGGANEVSNVTGATATAGSASIQALRVSDSTLTVSNGDTLTISGGLWNTSVAGGNRPQAPLILNNATIAGPGVFNAGANTLMLYGTGTSTISAQVTTQTVVTGVATGAPAMIKAGPGSVFFTNTSTTTPNSWGGTITIYQGSIGIIGPGGTNQSNVFGGARQFIIRGGAFEVKGGDYAPGAGTYNFGFAAAGGGLIVDDTSTFTLGAGIFNTSQFGSVGSNGPFYKGGTGTLVFSTANSWNGLTSVMVNQGTLQINGAQTANISTSAAAGNINIPVPAVINNGGTMAGTGSIPGILTVNPGGTISPGVTGFSAFGSGAVVFEPGGTYRMKYNPGTNAPVAGTDNDELTATSGGGNSGTLDLSNLSSTSKFNVNLVPALIATPPGGSVTYTVGGFSGITLPTGFSGTDVTSLFSFGGNFSGTPTATINGTNLQLSFVPIALTSFNWTGNVNGNWSVGNNWAGTAAPPNNSSNTILTFGATSNAAMNNDISGGMTLNGMSFAAGSPAYTLAGNALTFVNSSSNSGPSVSSSSSNPVALNVPVTLTNSLTVSGSGNVTLGGAVSGPGGLIMNGAGSVTLGANSNTFAGGINILNGTVNAVADGSLSTGPITSTALGTLNFTGTTSTARSFNLNGGTLSVSATKTLTLNGGTVSGGTFLDGAGTIATDPTNGAVFNGVASLPSVTIVSNSANDQFVHFNNSGNFSVAPGVNSAGTSSTVSLNGFTNQGLGSVTIGALAKKNLSNFQSYGTVSIAPAVITDTFTNTTLVKNVGTTAMGFNGGSRTFIGTPQTAVFPSGPNIGQPTFVAGIDLNGKNAIVTGGLFVNNGYVEDSTGGAATVVADFGSLVKGAGFFQNTVQTQNGGKFQAGNSPGSASFGSFVLGKGGVSDYVFAIDNATGAAGPIPDAAGHVSGWGLVKAINQGPNGATTGNFTWAANEKKPLTVSVETLVNPTTVGTDVPGQMANFDPNQAYSWSAVTWAGSYSGPTDASVLDATTTFDLSGFANPNSGRFGWALDLGGHNLSLTYSPSAVPEPGTLALGGLAALGFAARKLRRKKA